MGTRHCVNGTHIIFVLDERARLGATRSGVPIPARIRFVEAQPDLSALHRAVTPKEDYISHLRTVISNHIRKKCQAFVKATKRHLRNRQNRQKSYLR